MIEINPKFTLEIPHGTIELVENSGDKLSIWAVLNDGTIGCWNISVDNSAGNQVLQTKNCAELIPALPSRSVTSLIAHGNKVVIGYSDETVRIWRSDSFYPFSLLFFSEISTSFLQQKASSLFISLILRMEARKRQIDNQLDSFRSWEIPPWLIGRK